MKIRMPKLAAGIAALFTLASAVPGLAAELTEAALTEVPDGVIIAEAPAETESWTLTDELRPETEAPLLPEMQNIQTADPETEAHAEVGNCNSDGTAAPDDPISFFSDSDEGVPNVPVVHYNPAARGNASLVLSKAQEYVGWGYSQAKRMQHGFADCSSFVWRVFRSYGVNFGSATYAPTAAGIAQWLDQNRLTFAFSSASQLEPGDILFWGGRNNGRYRGIYHTGIYAGNGLVYEASSKCGVAVRTLWGVNEMPFAARLVTDESFVVANNVNIVELVRQARILLGQLQARGLEPDDNIRRIAENVGGFNQQEYPA